MRKRQEKFIGFCVTSFLIFAGFAGFTKNTPKEFKYGDFISEEKAYFGSKIDDPAGLIKAKKFVVPTDSKYSTQKTRSLGSGLIGDIESVWDSYTGKGTTVAIIDDGFDYNHPEYKRADGSSAILSTSRYYYLNSAQTACYYKEFSSDPTCIAEDWETDSSGSSWATHGTNTSTTAAAPINNVGGVGIAPEADILALKIDFSFASIQAAINYAIEQKVDVINMSLGAYAETFVDGWGDTQEGSSTAATYLNSVCKKAYQNNIIVVAAAGNESTYHKSYPACNTKVIGVGALGDCDNKGNANELAEFTNYVDPSQTGEINVDILAPGYVYTAKQSGTKTSISHSYGDTQGTSFSCPIVAGAACLWKEKYPSGTPDQFLEQLQSTADGIGDYANKYIKVSGWYPHLSDVGPSNITNGRLNVGKLLDIEKPFVSTVQSSLSISVGEKKQITLSTYDGSISYSSSNTSIATVSSTGLVEGVGTGDATITVTATKNGNTATATIEVHVASAVAATSISFNPTSVGLTVGQTYDAEATITVTPANASRMFLFESTDETVATVDIDTGLVTAIGEGSATIIAVPGYGEGSAELT
ncbi:MAG: S8 family serine peptidase, partial [Bacilli bacterium]|nr:S8 family serine peptidase [Bacilli bacterium]